MIIAKVGRQGQVVLPQPVQQWLNVEQGDQVIFFRRGNEFILQPLTQTLLDLRGSIPVNGPQDFHAIRQQLFSGELISYVPDED